MSARDAAKQIVKERAREAKLERGARTVLEPERDFDNLTKSDPSSCLRMCLFLVKVTDPSTAPIGDPPVSQTLVDAELLNIRNEAFREFAAPFTRAIEHGLTNAKSPGEVFTAASCLTASAQDFGPRVADMLKELVLKANSSPPYNNSFLYTDVARKEVLRAYGATHLDPERMQERLDVLTAFSGDRNRSLEMRTLALTGMLNIVNSDSKLVHHALSSFKFAQAIAAVENYIAKQEGSGFERARAIVSALVTRVYCSEEALICRQTVAQPRENAARFGRIDYMQEVGAFLDARHKMLELAPHVVAADASDATIERSILAHRGRKLSDAGGIPRDIAPHRNEVELFDRGELGALRINKATQFDVAAGTRFYEVNPIRTVSITTEADFNGTAFLSQKWLTATQTLRISTVDPAFQLAELSKREDLNVSKFTLITPRFGAAEATTLMKSPFFRNVTELGLGLQGRKFTGKGLAALAQSKDANHITSLSLADFHVENDSVGAALGAKALWKIDALELDTVTPTSGVVPLLASAEALREMQTLKVRILMVPEGTSCAELGTAQWMRTLESFTAGNFVSYDLVREVLQAHRLQSVSVLPSVAADAEKLVDGLRTSSATLKDLTVGKLVYEGHHLEVPWGVLGAILETKATQSLVKLELGLNMSEGDIKALTDSNQMRTLEKLAFKDAAIKLPQLTKMLQEAQLGNRVRISYPLALESSAMGINHIVTALAEKGDNEVDGAPALDAEKQERVFWVKRKENRLPIEMPEATNGDPAQGPSAVVADITPAKEGRFRAVINRGLRLLGFK